MATGNTLEQARELDLHDPLAPWRTRFVIDDPQLLYMDGNSLGRLPRQTQELTLHLVNEAWGKQLIRGWNQGWLNLPERLGAKIDRLDDKFVNADERLSKVEGRSQ